VRHRPVPSHLARRLLLVTLGLAAALIILEIVFRWVVPAAERPTPICIPPEMVARYEPGSGTYTLGPRAAQRGRWRINEEGWNNLRDYRRNDVEHTIAILGDSYVEAFHVDVDRAFFSILDEALGPQVAVYSFGRAGAPLSQLIHLSRYVARAFDPKTMVFVVIHNDFDQSLERFNPWTTDFMTIDLTGDVPREIPPTARNLSSGRRWAKRSALVRYLFYNLRISSVLQQLKNSEETRGIPVSYDRRVLDHLDEIERLVDLVVGRLRAENPHRRLIFVMDAPRSEIYESRLAQADHLLVLHRMMRAATDRHDCEWLDLTGPMARDFALRGVPFNSDLDYHWNETGHALVARELQRTITTRTTIPVESTGDDS